MGEATEKLCRIRQAGPKLPGSTSSALHSALMNMLNIPCNVNRYHFLLCFHYISVRMSPDGASQLCEGFKSSEYSYMTTLAQSACNVWSQPPRDKPLYCCHGKGFLRLSLLAARKPPSYSVSRHSRKHHIFKGKENNILQSFWRTRKGAGGRGQRAEKMQFHSWARPLGSPAWAGKDFTPKVITEKR